VVEIEGGRPAVIDLGEWGTGRVDDGPADGAGGWALWRGRARWLAALVPLVLITALGGAAARPAPPPLLWRLSEVNSFAVAGGALYADEPVTRRLVAYRLADGVPRWHRDDLAADQLYVDGDQLMASVPVSSGEFQAARLDPGTGATMSAGEAGVVGTTPDGSVITQSDAGHATRVTVVLSGTGERRTVATVPFPFWWILTPDNRQVIWVDDAGVLHVVDVTTGAERLRDTGLRPPAARTDETRPRIFVEVARDTLLVTARAEETTTVAAFARSDLDRRWVRTLAAPAALPNGERYFTVAVACGPLVCVPTPGTAGVGTDLLDPADGRLARHEDRQVLAVGTSRWQLVPTTDGGQVTGLYDVETGARPYPAWRILADVRPSSHERYLTSRETRGATDFGVFDTVTGRLTKVATLPGGYTGCQLDPPYLACLKAGGDAFVGVWRIAEP
jgi:hypothetical protein